jgi:hypothetical protein
MARKRRRVRRVKAGANGKETDELTQPTLSRSPEEEFREEYAYVIRDLRRVFILAVAMFILLIALNLVLS